MSYNITALKTKKISLTLPMDFDMRSWIQSLPDRDERGYENVGKRWCLEDDEECDLRMNRDARTWNLFLLNQELSGVIADQQLLVTDIDWRGDFSGHLYSDVLLPFFKEHKGDLEAIVIWECGDSINHLSIHDGIICDEELQ